MKKQEIVNHGGGMRWRSRRRLRGLLATGLMAGALVAGPALARPDPGPKKPTPVKKTGCVRGAYQKRYISQKRKFDFDHSYVRVTWHPRFCAQGNEWVTGNAPVVEQTGTGSNAQIKLELEAPRHIPEGVEYHGAVRKCLPGVSRKGIGLKEECFTVGRATFSAKVRGKAVDYAWKLDTTRWLKKIGGDKLIWTNKVI